MRKIKEMMKKGAFFSVIADIILVVLGLIVYFFYGNNFGLLIIGFGLGSAFSLMEVLRYKKNK